MAYGLMVYRSDGIVVQDVTDRLTRFVTSISISLNNSGQNVTVTGISTDGTWVAWASSPFATAKIYSGYVYVELLGRSETFVVNVLRV